MAFGGTQAIRLPEPASSGGARTSRPPSTSRRQTLTKRSILLAMVLCPLFQAGCSFGDAPRGLTPEETRAAVAALPPQQQIDYLNRSPLPPAEKQRRIADIKAQHGIK